MAQTIKLKRSNTSGAAPTTSQLELGEVAINTYDGKMYIKKNDGTEAVVEIGAGDITAVVAGNGLSNGGTTGDVTINVGAGDGIAVAANTVAVDSTVIRTTGNQTLGGTKTFSSEIVANAGIALGDNDKATFGVSDDLEIYHNGSHSYITDTGTGSLFVGGSSYVDIGNGVAGLGGQTYARFSVSGACQLNYNGVDKLKTISTGANITGSLGIGTTSPSEELHVVGDIIATGNVTAFFSDERLKDFQGTIPDALDKVNSLNGYYFTPNDTALGLGVEDKGVEVGISAQEVEAVLPEIVTDSAVGEGYKTVWYEKLTPLLIEAVKELTGKVDNLEARLKELEK